MRKFIKIMSIILIICSLSCTIFAETDQINNITTENTTTNTVTNETTDKKEKLTLDELKLKKSEIDSQITKSSEKIEYIEGELSTLLVKVEELNSKIKTKKAEIELLSSQEAVLKNEIEIVQEELNIANTNYLKQKKIAEERLVAMYEMGETTYLDVMLNSKGIKDFISKYYLVSEIATTDKELLENVNKIKVNVENTKAILETKKEELSLARSNREKTSIALENMNIVLSNYMTQLSSEELTLHNNIEQYNTEIENIEREILTLSLANVGSEYIGGTMAWPVPGYTRITSSYGMREHPITGVYKLHSGVDIGAPRGTSFVAANDGIVTKAEYNTAYGNMVIVDHGGGISTLYAHGDEISVEVGQTVKRGEEVLKVGTTGYSTGYHAHFEVRINGQTVEPLDYITSYNKETTEENVVELKETENSNE